MKRSEFYGLLTAIYTVGTALANDQWVLLLAFFMVAFTCLTVYWTFRE